MMKIEITFTKEEWKKLINFANKNNVTAEDVVAKAIRKAFV